MEPFSIRHGKAIQQLRIRVLMKDRLRTRLWMTIQNYNEHYSYEGLRYFPKAFIGERSVKLRVYDSTRPSLGLTRPLSSVLYVTFIIRICIAPHSCASGNGE